MSSDPFDVFIITEIKMVKNVEPGLPLPDGVFRKVAHDFEANDGLIRVGMPSVLSMYLNKYSELTEAWQWFWFRQMVHAYTRYVHWDEKKLSSTELGILKAKWRSLTKTSEAFTNFKGTDRYKDYVTPNKLTTGNPGQEPLACTGNVVKILTDQEIRFAGQNWIAVETLDGSLPPPPIDLVNHLTRPDLVPCATNVPANKPSNNSDTWTLMYLADGTWKIDPFPQLAPGNTPFPLRTNGKEANNLKVLLRDKGNNYPAGTYEKGGIKLAVNYIRSVRLKLLQGGVVPSPYNPPKVLQ